jgi:hypothetical protein
MGRKYPNMDKGTEGQWLLTVTTPKEGKDPEDIEKCKYSIDVSTATLNVGTPIDQCTCMMHIKTQ